MRRNELRLYNWNGFMLFVYHFKIYVCKVNEKIWKGLPRKKKFLENFFWFEWLRRFYADAVSMGYARLNGCAVSMPTAFLGLWLFEIVLNV